jgi:outer membrane beta-barrel protein
MKQARRWLLFAAALALVPQVAFAQKKKPKPTPAATPAPADSSSAAGTTAAPADADAPAAGTPAAPASADSGTPAATPAPGGDEGGADICSITPDAPQCTAAKEINFAEEAKKQLKSREIYAVQQQYVMKAHRFEIQPYWEFTLNDQFVSHPGPGLALNYYITQVLAVGVDGTWYGGLNADSDFNFQNRRAAYIAVPLNNYQLSGDLNFTYVPMYGKFAGFGDFIFSYDSYVLGGLGVIRTEPIAVIDPNDRNFTWNTYVNVDLAVGFRIFFTRWLAAVIELRDIIFFDKLESLTVAPSAAQLGTTKGSSLDPCTWYQGSTDSSCSGTNYFTNDVQLQLGISIFLPTSFEYRLAK